MKKDLKIEKGRAGDGSKGYVRIDRRDRMSIGVERVLLNRSFLISLSQKIIVNSLHRKSNYSHISGQINLQIF